MAFRSRHEAPCRGVWLTLNLGPVSTWCRYVAALRAAAPKHAPAGRRVTVLALQERARLRGQLTWTVAVQDRDGGGVSLSDYMRLPVEQYNELDPDMTTSLGGNRFRLIVPRLILLNVWLQPVVTVRVASFSGEPGGQPRVILWAEHCSLHGSELVERVHLDRRFTLHFMTELTWTPGEGPPSSGGGAIHGALTLEVLTDIVPPFNLLPRTFLEATCNMALQGLTLRTLLPIFLRQLAADYQRWSTQADYRARRAAAASGLGLAPPE